LSNLEKPFLEIGRLIRNLRISAGFAQHELAEQIGINNSYLSRIENGERRPSPKIMKKMAKVLPTTYEDLVQASGLISDDFTIVPKAGAMAPRKDISKTIQDLKNIVATMEKSPVSPRDPAFDTRARHQRRSVPVYDRIPAGFFDEANVVRDFDNIEQIVLTEEEIGYDPKAFALRVRGSSMVNAGILEDDIVIVSPSSHVENGDIAAVGYQGVDITLKKFYCLGEVFVLQPCNPEYPPVTITDPDELSILGKVILVRRKLI